MGLLGEGMTGFEMTFTRSTPERRAAVFAIKLLFDEAHRLGEAGDLAAYARAIAGIETALAAINPRANPDDANACAAIVHAKGAAAGRAWLDARLDSLGQRLTHFENQLRIAFGVEMEGGACVALGLIKFV